MSKENLENIAYNVYGEGFNELTPEQQKEVKLFSVFGDLAIDKILESHRINFAMQIV